MIQHFSDFMVSRYCEGYSFWSIWGPSLQKARTKIEVVRILVWAFLKLEQHVSETIGSKGPKNLLAVSKSGLESIFQCFDLRWSSLDITDDFKPITEKVYLCFSEMKKLLLCFVFVQKHFFYFYFQLEMVDIFEQKII